MNRGLCFMLFFIFIFIFSNFVFANPFGADVVDEVNSTRASPTSPESIEAIAGNVSEVNIYGWSITRSWQGYFGNVTGSIILADSVNNIMYNWSVASPRGQLYASTNGTDIQWSSLQCFNYTASGTFADDTANAGGTSLYGMNLTQLHDIFNINSSGFDGTVSSSRDDDSVDNTFVYYGTELGNEYGSLGRGHRQFYSTFLNFEEGQCWTARIFGPGGTQVESEFEEALLYEPESRSIIFTALLNEDLLGFDGRTHDFQMLVLEDGHGIDTDTTTYYFYLEIQ